MTPSRLPTRISNGIPTSDGAGVRLTRLMGGDPRMPSVDPFLMLDYFDSPNASDYLAGFPAHPHRGFETVTYMLNGRMRHKDNHGNEGVIETGGIQWMTAGRGIVHSEMPEQTEGLMRGFQLWVNLPSKLKLQAPAYQEHPAAAMPIEKRDGIDVKVIAGTTSQGTKGPVTVEPTGAKYFDLTLADGATFAEPLDASYAGFVVVHDGAIVFPDGREVASLGIAELGNGDEVRFTAKGAARVLVIAGKPLREPVAWHGPFVMNTRDELVQAFED
ncbi:MAG TPA: pirin family protein, partial [Casimicrobiaceae bacterium]